MLTFLALLAAGLTTLAAAVRYWDTRRVSSVAGLAAGFAWLAMITNTGWLAYGLAEDIPAQVVPSTAWLIVTVYMLWRIQSEGRSQVRAGILAAAGMAGMVALAVWIPDLAGFAAGSVGVASCVPQLTRVWKTKEQAGVGPVAWMFSAVLGVAWVAYGLAAGLAPVWVTNSVFVLLAVGILAGYQRAGKVRTNARVHEHDKEAQ